MLFSLFLFSSLIFSIDLAPTSHDLSNLDFRKTYMQFFKIKDLIDKINIKRFEEFYGPVLPSTSETTPAPTPVSPPAEVASDTDPEETLPEIDLTEEAILSQAVQPRVTEVTEDVTATLPLNDGEETTVAPQPQPDPTTITPLEIDLTTVTPLVSLEAETTLAPVVEDREDTTIPNDEDPETNEVSTDLEQFISEESAAAAKKYGYKILLKKVGGKEVPVGKIKFSIPTIVEMEEEQEAVDENQPPTTTLAPLDIADSRTGEEAVTETVPVSAPPPEPISSVVPSLDISDDTAVAEGVRKVAEDAELAVEEIKNQTTSSEVIVFGECSAPLSQVEAMLAGLARNVAAQSDNLAQILSLGKTLKDQTEAETLTRTGAEILRLVDPFLSSLVPPEVTSCAGSSSTAMLVSLSGVASQLDTIAAREESEVRASSLHNTATSLQLAAWVISTLENSVQAFYTKRSSTTDILGSLSDAITGYIPIVTMLGNQESVEELERTIKALSKAKADIKTLESQTGASLPGVDCDASFSEMALALDGLADFVKVVQTNEV